MFVSVKLYVVFVDGETDGFEMVELNPEGELDHEYVLPVTAAPPIEIEELAQIAEFAITDAAGKGFTVITTELVLLQPVEFIVSVNEYVVVEDGFTVGFDDDEVKPDGELVHE